MTYLSILRPSPDGAGAVSVTAGGRRAALHFAVFAAAAAGILVGRAYAPDAGAPGMEQSLVALLRFMAVLKAATALAMLALTHWRLTRPARPGLAFAYGAATALAAAAPGLIWSLSTVALGAVLFHIGLVTFLLLAWRDDTVELKFHR